jgi:serine/threonine protein phosphatase 1
MFKLWNRRRKEQPAASFAPSMDPLSSLPEGARIFAIGDIHGCDNLLEQIHQGIDDINLADPPQMSIEVVLGDMVDRGPDSRGVIERLIARARRTRLVVLSGNHEAMMLRSLASQGALRQWLSLGGLETLRSYGVSPDPVLDADSAERAVRHAMAAIPDEHIAFLQALPFYWSLGDLTFVHAGLRPGIQLNRQAKRDLLEIRDPFLTFPQSFGTFVIHGHTPRPDVEILHNRINLDTGAFATGCLSAAVFEKNQIRLIQTNRPPSRAG